MIPVEELAASYRAAGKKWPATILGLGHPRSGTKYLASLLNAYGWNVGHEELRGMGIVAWQLASRRLRPSFSEITRADIRPGLIIHITRNPLDVIRSSARTEAGAWRTNRLREAGSFEIDKKRPYEANARAVLYWDQLIRDQGPDLTLRVETAPEELGKFLGASEVKGRDLGRVNSRKYQKEPDEAVLDSLDPDTRERVLNLCEVQGYPMRAAA